MAKLIVDSHYDIGGYRDVYEDRVCACHLATPAGLKIAIAAVADGVGGENKGELAAQTAIDALLAYFEKSAETDERSLLVKAFQSANQAVYQLKREAHGASTTLAAAIVNEKTNQLFIANVGDSRIYLCRKQKLTQLTIDHTFATEMVRRGQLSADLVRGHPRSNVLMRALGMQEQVEVDTGFYVGTTNYQEANRRSIEGLVLQQGDSILVCSDGLVKDSPKTHQPLITTQEIVRTLREKEGKKAAQELVSFALGRDPDDNISASLIQVADPRRKLRSQRPMLLAWIAILSLVVLLGILAARLRSATQELSTLAKLDTATAREVLAAYIYTQTPTSAPTLFTTTSPFPGLAGTLPPGGTVQAGISLPGNQPIYLKDPLLVGTEAVQMSIYHLDTIKPRGYLYAQPGSSVKFTFAGVEGSSQAPVFGLQLGPGSEVFLDSGGYTQAYLDLKDQDIVFRLSGCMAVIYNESPLLVKASCYDQICIYQNLVDGKKVLIEAGKQLVMEGEKTAPSDLRSIPESEARQWIQLLPQGSTLYDCANLHITNPTFPSATHPGVPTTATETLPVAPSFQKASPTGTIP